MNLFSSIINNPHERQANHQLIQLSQGTEAGSFYRKAKAATDSAFPAFPWEPINQVITHE